MHKDKPELLNVQAYNLPLSDLVHLLIEGVTKTFKNILAKPKKKNGKP
jgi:hypothetical protein